MGAYAGKCSTIIAQAYGIYFMNKAGLELWKFGICEVNLSST